MLLLTLLTARAAARA